MSREVWHELYRSMHRIRRTEEIIAELYPRQEMRCPVHLCIGQEATPAGVCAELLPSDYAFSTHRSHGHYLAKGGSLRGLLGELYGRACGCSGGKGGSMHMVDLDANFLGAAPILGATIALAVGTAFGTKLRGEPHVSVAFFGDAAVEEGIFYESANFAALKKLPVVLVCENNGLSTCSKLDVRQPAGRSLCDLARGIGLSAAAGDGNDVLEVARLARESVRHAREGKGPYFLEFAVNRWFEHCGPGYDFHLGYRPESELAGWQAHCPLASLRRHMETNGAWDPASIAAMEADVEREIRDEVTFVRQSPYPTADQLMQHEYAP